MIDSINVPVVIIGNQYLEYATPQIAAAKETIDIIMYHWRLRPSLPNSPVSLLLCRLLEAQARGVRVRCLVSSEGIKRQLFHTPFDVKVLHFDKLMHAKMLLMDGRRAIVGSHNFSHSAFTSNLEVSLLVEFPTLDNDLSTYFKNLWSV